MTTLPAPNPAPARVPAAVHTVRTTCRGCGGGPLRLFLSLGPQPLANAFLTGPADFAGERSYPLDVCICADCALVQIRDVIDPEVLFGHYLYVTGTSDTIAAHNVDYAASVSERLALGPADLVVEVASNDGSLLRAFQAGGSGARVLGVEPATNIAAMARDRGVPTVNAFFNSTTAREVREAEGLAKVVLANNVLAHVDDPRDFLSAACSLLAPGGRVVVEVPYAQDMLDRLEYDTVYHEHLCYFSVSALGRIAESAGLTIRAVERQAVHGGTIRVWFGAGGEHAPEVQALMTRERETLSEKAWRAFAERAHAHRDAIREQFERWRREGRRVAGYGAPAKANTFLNFCGLDPSLLRYTVDRNPLKVGTFTPGMHLPVHAVEHLAADAPELTVILAWNFADEIMRQQAAYRRAGGRFFVAIPRLEELT